MDAQAKKKAFRAKLNAQKKEKRIESPLVRYNESDQPVCRVCNVVLKSDSSWDAHQASRKHHEAIKNFKANAAGLTHGNNVQPKSSTESTSEPPKIKHEASINVSKAQSSSMLPPNFFDNGQMTSQQTDSARSVNPDSHKKSEIHPQIVSLHSETDKNGLPSGNVTQTKTVHSARELVPTSKQITDSEPKRVKGVLPKGFFDDEEAALPTHSVTKELTQTSVQSTGSEPTSAKGALPEGFFDNKEADLRARGIKLVKPDVKDEYKEFERLIQEDLKDVDNRMEEEEFDAAEMIEEEEFVEQKSYNEKVEMLKRKKMELEAARSAKRKRGSKVPDEDPPARESSSDDDSDADFAVDWRAQHL